MPGAVVDYPPHNHFVTVSIEARNSVPLNLLLKSQRRFTYAIAKKPTMAATAMGATNHSD
jgi:hypothetical protein